MNNRVTRSASKLGRNCTPTSPKPTTGVQPSTKKRYQLSFPSKSMHLPHSLQFQSSLPYLRRLISLKTTLLRRDRSLHQLKTTPLTPFPQPRPRPHRPFHQSERQPSRHPHHRPFNQSERQPSRHPHLFKPLTTTPAFHL